MKDTQLEFNVTELSTLLLVESQVLTSQVTDYPSRSLLPAATKFGLLYHIEQSHRTRESEMDVPVMSCSPTQDHSLPLK